MGGDGLRVMADGGSRVMASGGAGAPSVMAGEGALGVMAGGGRPSTTSTHAAPEVVDGRDNRGHDTGADTHRHGSGGDKRGHDTGGRTVGRAAPALLPLLLTALLLLLSPLPARADPAPQLAGLFMQACLPYAGDAAALRDWARKTGLPEVPEPARKIFLHGAPGTVFDASVPPEKFVLLSPDDGLCAALTNQAVGADVIRALESDLTAAGIAFRLAIERNDKAVPEIHDREYLATKNGHGWRILIATVKDPKGGQAMLTAAPE